MAVGACCPRGVQVRWILVLGLAACTGSSAAPAPSTRATGPLQPILYGFWGLNGYHDAQGMAELRGRLGMGVFQVASEDPAYVVGSLLPAARQAGVKVTLRLTGDHRGYTRDGDFDLALWKARLAPWKGSGVEAFIQDGTLVGHMLLDDISNFRGHDPTAAELEEMARTSKELLPGLMTFVREKATDMPAPPDGRYRQVDAIVNQYKAADGPVQVYAQVQRERALALDLGIINGLNINDGGDGSSGQPGWLPRKHWAMSAPEILRYGAALLAVPECGMFLNWEYDAVEVWPDGTIGARYFDRPELQAALAELGRMAAAHQGPPLMRP